MTLAPVGGNRETARSAWLLAACWLAVAALFVGKMLSRAVSGQMFFDGVIYASVARNLADGFGTPWQPRFGEVLMSPFVEHPPLQLWLQGAVFWLVGDSPYVERFYGVGMAVLTGAMVVGLWRLLTRGEPRLRPLGWLPLILLLSTTRVTTVAASNFIENTLGMFATMAVFLAAWAFNGDVGARGRLAMVLGAGLATAAAVLAKGPVGMFPLATAGLGWLVLRRPNFKAAVVTTLVMSLAVAAVLAVLWQWTGPREYMQGYADKQLFGSLSGQRGNRGGGLPAIVFLWQAISKQLLACIALVIVGWAFGRLPVLARLPPQAGSILQAIPWRQSLFMLLVGVSASLPILVSPRVNDFYFEPSIAFYTIAFALIAAPATAAVLAIIPATTHRGLAAAASLALLVCIAILPLQAGRVTSHQALLHDVSVIGQRICREKRDCRETVSVCEALWPQWQLHAYLQRYQRISLAPSDTATDFRIVDGSCGAGPEGYRVEELDLVQYRLLRRAPAG